MDKELLDKLEQLAKQGDELSKIQQFGVLCFAEGLRQGATLKSSENEKTA